MDENRLRFGVGVLVISAIGIGIILTFLFGAFPRVLQREYTLLIVFPSAEGIGANTPVVRDGVRIGRVSSIDLLDEGGVLVTLSMDASKTLPYKYVPRISSGNFVTGDAQLEFVLADQARLTELDLPGESTDLYRDGDYLDYGQKSESLFDLQEDLLQTFTQIQIAGQAISQAAASVDQLSQEVQVVVGGADSKVEQVADEAVEALRAFQGTMQDIRAVINDPELRENLETSIAQLPELLQEAQAAFASTQTTFQSFERVGKQFERVGLVAEDAVVSVQTTVDSAQQSVKNIERFTDPLGRRSEELLNQVFDTLTSLERTSTQVEEFGKTLNNSDGTVKRLLEDDDLYWQIRRTVENIENATARVRPILDDVRIFSDKIARDPRQLGVRGALTKRPSGTGLK
jgi:phospholipid/cholesterol/gamma-HCH transport system substrate-binding protein